MTKSRGLVPSCVVVVDCFFREPLALVRISVMKTCPGLFPSLGCGLRAPKNLVARANFALQPLGAPAGEGRGQTSEILCSLLERQGHFCYVVCEENHEGRNFDAELVRL